MAWMRHNYSMEILRCAQDDMCTGRLFNRSEMGMYKTRNDNHLIFVQDDTNTGMILLRDRSGIKLAESLHAVLDNTSSVCHGPGLIAHQLIGESTCTLGEVKNRADVIVYWGSNPEHAHPRHLKRYTADATGRFRPNGRSDRKVIVVDIRETPTA